MTETMAQLDTVTNSRKMALRKKLVKLTTQDTFQLVEVISRKNPNMVTTVKKFLNFRFYVKCKIQGLKKCLFK